MAVGDNIKRLREINNLTQEQLASKLGVTRESVVKWESGKINIRDRHVSKLVELFGIEPDDIKSENYGLASNPLLKPKPETIRYSVTSLTAPVYGRIAAGDALEMLSVSDEAYVIPQIAEKHPSGFFLTISGDSMDLIMPNGSLAYVDPNMEVRSGDVAVVNVNGDDATVKRIFFAGNTIVLHPESDNPDHRDRSIDSNDPDAPRVRMLGKVVWHYMVNDDRL